MWKFGIDRGGTFTDIIGMDGNNKPSIAKVLSHSKDYSDPGIEGIKKIMQIDSHLPLPKDKIQWIRMGTTVATNALLEKKGAQTALLINQGFGDIVEIGTQERKDLFSLKQQAPELLYNKVCEIKGRISKDNEEIEPFCEHSYRQQLKKLKSDGIESLAIVQLFSWLHPEHEVKLGNIAQEYNFSHISLSHQTLKIHQAIKRSQITILDAYLSPILSKYLEQIEKETLSIPIYFMGSSGSLFGANSFQGKEAILSGPAGGVLALSKIENQLKEPEALLGFDMGGTSTDISRFDQEFEYAMDHTLAEIPFSFPMLRVDTVAAGGGSVIHFDGERLCVGPQSAGSLPGPACYMKGGPATVTDANLILGRIQPDYFPSIFGLHKNESLSLNASKVVFTKLQKQMKKAGFDYSIVQIAAGCIQVANETMARPIRDLTIGRGLDTRKHTLVSFGGAGAQNSCGIARKLGIKKILIPQNAGILSAQGILEAIPSRQLTFSVLKELSESNCKFIETEIKKAVDHNQRKLSNEHNTDLNDCSSKVSANLQIKGSEGFIKVPWSNTRKMMLDFSDLYDRQFGSYRSNSKLEIAEILIESKLKKSLDFSQTPSISRISKKLDPINHKQIYTVDGKMTKTPIFSFDQLKLNTELKGPALITGNNSTIFVDRDYKIRRNNEAFLEIEHKKDLLKDSEKEAVVLSSHQKDPILLEIFNNRFMSIAEQMGEVLIRNAHSVNMKERKDFSCALFDFHGNLIANAPHIPVHLGAMGETVKDWLKNKLSELTSDQFYYTNDPFAGGSHLPDITVITPVFRNFKLAYILACRGHHADIGGIVPGSMPPFAKGIEEEGIRITHELLADKNGLKEDWIRSKLSEGSFPARNIPERISDLIAQMKSVQHGVKEINRLCNEYGENTVSQYGDFIRKNAFNEVQRVLKNFIKEENELSLSAEEVLDEGHKICLKVTIKKDGKQYKAIFDFEGTSAEVESNLNAPFAVSRAVVLYGLRCLVDRPIPLNEGSMENIEILIPENTILNPSKGKAVSGGNVETSQRVVDCFFYALGTLANSQGTMNNFLFGNADGKGNQYYETIAGGSGASSNSSGSSAKQVHMTNTSITDPETLEIRFPQVRLEEFSVRRNSGGIGKHSGGDGVIRRFRFLKKQVVSIISQRRKVSAKGLNGGEDGKLGENLHLCKFGKKRALANSVQQEIEPNECIEILTPGGGGYGKKGSQKLDLQFPNPKY